MTARDDILTRIRTALADRPRSGPIVRDYHPAGTAPADRGPLIEILVDRLRDYRATVTLTTTDRLPAAVAAAVAEHGAEAVAVPADLPETWLGATRAELHRDDPPLPTDRLATVDCVLTGCALAIAETGTLVLDHGVGQGRRALTLVPDLHLVVLDAGQVVAGVPDAVAALHPATHATQTWISGPSATSDIELNRVEGVHGPRRLHVIIARGAG